MKHLRRYIAAFALISLTILCSCSRIKDITVLSCSVESFSMVGLRGAKATVLANIENPAMSFNLSEISGIVYYKGKAYVDYSADDISIDGKTTAVYPLECRASVSEGVSLLEILSLVRNHDLEDFTTDITARVKLKSGLSKKLKFKDIPIKDLVE